MQLGLSLDRRRAEGVSVLTWSSENYVKSLFAEMMSTTIRIRASKKKVNLQVRQCEASFSVRMVYRQPTATTLITCAGPLCLTAVVTFPVLSTSRVPGDCDPV